MSEYIQHNQTVIAFDSDESWVILSPIELSIKQKIETIGTPLKNWDISINYGIKTGFNDAFIISGEKKDELISQDPKSAEIIRPILRGRDIKRYSYTFADLWLIATFPSRKYNIDDYPAVRDYLLTFGIERLEQTGKSHKINGETIKSRKKTSNKWFETQDSISYWDDFSKQKIMYNDITQKLSFALVQDEMMCVNTVYFIKYNEHIEYLLAALNTSLMDWYYRTLSVQLGEKAVRMFSIYVLNIPIPIVNEEAENEIVCMQKNHEKYDRYIDEKFFDIFGLTTEEREYIRSMYYDN